MDSIGAALFDGVQDGLGVELTLSGSLAAEGVGLISHSDVKSLAVKFGIHRHGGNSHLASGANHSDGDLAAVGNQDLCKWFGGHK